MIQVQDPDHPRGAEPPSLTPIRTQELARVQHIRATRPLTSEDFGRRYNELRPTLWTLQHHKCCYCELICHEKYHDVEHFRPKAEARRDMTTTDPGYWWLAWTWENLFFACPGCNRSPKSSWFPLLRGAALSPHQIPPAHEHPALLDPLLDDPLDHIQFRPVRAGAGQLRPRWMPTPRNGSRRGAATIRYCGLARQELLDEYTTHIEFLEDFRLELAEALQTPDMLHPLWSRTLKRLLAPTRPFLALTYDALDAWFPPTLRAHHRLSLPRPSLQPPQPR